LLYYNQSFIKYNTCNDAIATDYSTSEKLTRKIWKSKNFSTAFSYFKTISKENPACESLSFSLKDPFGERSIRRNVHSVKYPFGEMVIRLNVHSAKYPFGETSIRRNGFGEMGFGEMAFGETYRNRRSYIAALQYQKISICIRSGVVYRGWKNCKISCPFQIILMIMYRKKTM
jgi:hypothetical protein